MISQTKFHKTYKATDKRNNNIKYLVSSSNSELDWYSFQMCIDLYQMLNIISKINHPSILKFIVFSTTDFESVQYPTIVTEYSKYRTNIDFSKNPMIIIYGIASAMSYLHSHGILHRNLGLENIYLDKSFHPKLTGFDCSVDISSKLGQQSTTKFFQFQRKSEKSSTRGFDQIRIQ